RIYENTLVVETIHYPDEVRAVSDVPNIPEESGVVKKELDTAKLLIDQLTTTFEPDKYTDDYRTALLEVSEDTKYAETVTATTPESKATDNVTNLMSASQATLDKANKTHATKKKTTKTPANKVAT